MNKADWQKAEEHLKACEQAYGRKGGGTTFAMVTVVSPCRRRLEKRERTQDLYQEIMSIKL